MGDGLSLDVAGHGSVTALLGPTNTGKTFHAIQRMLQHRSGMIGLPLRLLAREVYDKVVAAKGADQVALVTGEEKIVPANARYWVCTTESMPIDRPVAFVAVDEVQLAADRARGHVFTDRLLRARGVAETWFLGSDAVEGVLQDLVPTAVVKRQPRLSRLSFAGHRKLGAVPPRSAVVAFSAARVYALAERLRVRAGGVAVVLGALSPRARNAQVGMFEAGEVDRLVATDAIGMGLNLDVHHVALAATAKFDGVEHRPLRVDEIAQIAGRAGRWRRDGTFGTTDDAEPLTSDLVDEVEAHRFPPLRRVWWRNPDPDLGSIDALQASLALPPRRRVLMAVRGADDEAALARLAEDPEVRALARGEPRVRLLWEVCGVPDFGNVLPEHHAALLRTVYLRLVEAPLSSAYLAEQLRRLDRTEGDIDTLTARIAGVRVWTYLTHRPEWVEEARAWQEAARQVEDRLSDALHQRLVARFVDHRVGVVRAGGVRESTGGSVAAGGVSVGRRNGVSFQVDPGLSLEARREVLRRVAPLLAEAVIALEGASNTTFTVDPRGTVRWDGHPVARLVKGAHWRAPGLRLLPLDGLDGAQRQVVQRRLDRWRAAWLAGRDAWGEALTARTAAGRGLVHALVAGEGFVRRREVAPLLSASHADAAALQAAGVVAGRSYVVVPRAVGRVAERATLWAVWSGEALELPDDGGEAPFELAASREGMERIGFLRRGAAWVRVDRLA